MFLLLLPPGSFWVTGKMKPVTTKEISLFLLKSHYHSARLPDERGSDKCLPLRTDVTSTNRRRGFFSNHIMGEQWDQIMYERPWAPGKENLSDRKDSLFLSHLLRTTLTIEPRRSTALKIHLEQVMKEISTQNFGHLLSPGKNWGLLATFIFQP